MIALISVVVSIVSLYSWYIFTFSYLYSFELLRYWYAWIICGFIAPILPVISKRLRIKKNDYYIAFIVMEIIGLVVGLFDILSAAVLAYNVLFKLAAVIVAITCTIMYFQKTTGTQEPPAEKQ